MWGFSRVLSGFRFVFIWKEFEVIVGISLLVGKGFCGRCVVYEMEDIVGGGV